MKTAIVTGNFGSGKTTVGKLLEELGCAFLNSDRVVASLYAKKNVQKALVGAFGKKVIFKKKVNRAFLAGIVFSDKKKRKKLEGIVHPIVFAEIRKFFKRFRKTKKIAVAEAPLFFESPVSSNLRPDFVIVAWCKQKKALARLKKKGFSEKETLARMNAQLPISKKKRLADFVVDNSKPVESTRKQVKQIFNEIQYKPRLKRLKARQKLIEQMQAGVDGGKILVKHRSGLYDRK
ncbi:MAG: dephospho-CoA kinase [archaeon]|nr:dephospho-CoA kinase [archaeon]